MRYNIPLSPVWAGQCRRRSIFNFSYFCSKILIGWFATVIVTLRRKNTRTSKFWESFKFPHYFVQECAEPLKLVFVVQQPSLGEILVMILLEGCDPIRKDNGRHRIQCDKYSRNHIACHCEFLAIELWNGLVHRIPRWIFYRNTFLPTSFRWNMDTHMLRFDSIRT